MNKSQKTIFIAGSIFIALSIIVISITTYANYFPDRIPRYISTLFPTASAKSISFHIKISEIILIKANVLLSEIIWTEIIGLKTLHTLLATDQQEYRKLLCGISLVLLFVVVILLCLYERSYPRHDFTNIRYLYAAWLGMLIAFILGNIKIKKRKIQEDNSME